MHPAPPRPRFSRRNLSLPENTSKPSLAKASIIALVLFMSPELSFMPTTV